jgi:signal transduction histidine kinase/DNA-binding NarL/FixJ family response regulator
MESMAEAIKVLIIDDSDDDQLLYRRALNKAVDAKFEIIGAQDGEDGFARMADVTPDCVLLDYSLPGRNGIEVLKRLRANHPFLPVAMLTGQGNETVAVAAMQEGAQNYISKSSITPETLQRAVCVSIEHCAMQKRIFEQRSALEAEINVRRQAEHDAQARMERLSLLQQITRAVSERQDLDSIFQVVVRSLEDHLPVAFACLCLYDRDDKVLTVARVGSKNLDLGRRLSSPENARLPIGNGPLARCAAGEFVYAPQIQSSDFALAQHLERAGLRSLVLSPLQVEGKPTGIIVVARDEPDAFSEGEREFLRQLSEHVALAAHQAQLYTALQQAYDKLQQTQQAVMQQERLRAVGQMASGIAHDINNALSPVVLYAHSLLETEPLSPRGRGFLEVMQRAVEDVTHTVARLRDFYRQREPQLTLLPTDLNALAQQVIDLTRARWSDMSLQRGVVIEIDTDLAADLPAVLGVEAEIREALVNLILNAVDALPEGGKVKLRTAVQCSDGRVEQVRFEVADTGSGMSEETRRRCLEPFYSTKGERGTGLGLAMVYGVAQRHNAAVEIESELGRGTTVSIVFPPTAVADTKAVERKVAAPVLAKLRLLLVDDDALVLNAMRTTLQMDGHEIEAATGGQAGIDAFTAATKRGEHFAAVITDLGMPHIDGRKVAAAVKALSPATPVILLTGWGAGALPAGESASSVDGVLGKPARLNDLRAMLANLVKPMKAAS